MTLAELITECRLRINAEGDDFYSDPEIVSYLNRAREFLTDKFPRFRNHTNVKQQAWTCVNGQSEYLLNDATTGIITAKDLFTIRMIRNADTGYTLPLINPEEEPEQILPWYLRPLEPTSYGMGWSRLGDTLKLTPAPASDIDFTIYYYYSLPAFAYTNAGLALSPTWLPSEFHDLLVLRAVMRMLDKDERDKAKIKEEFDERFFSFKDYIKLNANNDYKYEPSY